MDGDIRSLPFKSDILNTEFDLHVYLPPNYHESISYHLAVAQDGQDFFRLGKIGRKIEDMILEEAGPETIVVGVPYPRVAARRKWYHPDGEELPQYLQFLTAELLPFLAQEYSLHEDPEGRVLMGDSLAGTLALLACLEHPDTFSRAIMYSPYVNDTLLSKIDESSHLGTLTLYHTVGSEEREVKGTDGTIMDFISMNNDLHERLNANVSNYRFKTLDKGDHTWYTWEPDLHKALHFMYIFNA
ncbi:alpha/beta hydrolase [Natribacillus halophilus]|uniref:Enterochelin esterase n=1 Tax=Natribacillus halophilus TaxID=549003 RepID=A0A1G8LFC2_9BACI|nr:alpha/beta hydrolase-fold protein [Natribacillus halophilus]SDI53900.1 Enterochelin esterase [Natribacillus halophilus]